MMTTMATQNWQKANQDYLMNALSELQAALISYIEQTGEVPSTLGERAHKNPEVSLSEFASNMSAPPQLEALCNTFGLSSFERSVLLLCAGMELDATFAPLCAAVQSDSQRAYPTFAMALAALPDAHWSAFTPTAPLRRWRLIELGEVHTLAQSPLRINERILHFLIGLSDFDEQLLNFLEPLGDLGDLTPSHQALAEQIVSIWEQADDLRSLPVVQLVGSEAANKRIVAAAACAMSSVDLRVMSAHTIPSDPANFKTLCRLWERETILSNSALLLDCDGVDSSDPTREGVINRFIDNIWGLLIITSRQRRTPQQRPIINVDVAQPIPEEQYTIWQHLLGTNNPALNGQINLLVSQFNLSALAIRAAYTGALGRLASAAEEPASVDELQLSLWDACRMQARPHLGDLAQHIEPRATWEELVLPDQQRQILHDIVVQVRQRHQVYKNWGFATKSARGLGISALFTGSSGTGKTMAAEVLADELNLDLYRIDLSAMVSKYIGETEKNLRRVFDAAETGGAILLFDEADALFGKRSEVKDSHDRYANIEVSYLLQRMEAYRGLAILTTNLQDALDKAFLRRIRFIVKFPFPDAAQRAEIWRRIFPKDTPTEALDITKLARLNIAGGNIRNIAMHAAFLAADAGEPVQMKYLLKATQHEYLKLEKPMSNTETNDWI